VRSLVFDKKDVIIILSFFQKVNYLLEIYKYFRICMIFFSFSIESEQAEDNWHFWL